MKEKFNGIIVLLVSLFILIWAVRDIYRGYSVTYWDHSDGYRINKPPQLEYYLWVVAGAGFGVIFSARGLAMIFIPSERAEKTGNKTQTACPHCGGLLRTNKAKQCSHCFKFLQ